MNSLFNIKDNQEFLGIRSEASLSKAKKDTPQYEEWLRKYREKRASKSENPSSGETRKRPKVMEQAESHSDGISRVVSLRDLKTSFMNKIPLSEGTHTVDGLKVKVSIRQEELRHGGKKVKYYVDEVDGRRVGGDNQFYEFTSIPKLGIADVRYRTGRR